MPNRRTFISTGIASTGTVAFSGAVSAESSADQTRVDGYNYRLPAFAKGSRLLFQGDSITDMKWGRNERDRNHFLGHSYVYLLAARLGIELADARLDFYNRGMSGHTVADLRKRWQKDAVDMHPDLLSILIGTNDVGRGVQVESFESDYRHLLDVSLQANAELRIVLLAPFVLQSGKLKDEQSWRSRREATDKLGAVVSRIAKDYGAVLIETQGIFDSAVDLAPAEHWIWDGVHPLPQGHELIARHWLERVSARWPKT
ncbi:MAG: SGNH/GDSL hydrolase family protein [Rubripirellula sp.]